MPLAKALKEREKTSAQKGRKSRVAVDCLMEKKFKYLATFADSGLQKNGSRTEFFESSLVFVRKRVCCFVFCDILRVFVLFRFFLGFLCYF